MMRPSSLSRRSLTEAILDALRLLCESIYALWVGASDVPRGLRRNYPRIMNRSYLTHFFANLASYVTMQYPRSFVSILIKHRRSTRWVASEHGIKRAKSK